MTIAHSAHTCPTCQAESKDGEDNQDVQKDDGVLDGCEGVQVTAALILLPATLPGTWQERSEKGGIIYSTVHFLHGRTVHFASKE